MSGHSKWKTIQHKKGAADAKRGKVFSKISKEIMVAAKGGANLEMNATLRTLVSKARSANMPADNIQRAIKKGTGELAGAALETIVYEGYAGGGVGIIVEALTDNKNRAASEIRHIFTKHGSNFAAQGSVSRNFKRKGQIFVDASATSEEKVMDIVLEAGADDMTEDDGQFEIVTDPSSFVAVVEALEKAEIKTASAEVTLIPDVYVPVGDKSVASAVFKLISELDENEDVQNVHANMDASDEVLKELETSE